MSRYLPAVAVAFVFAACFPNSARAAIAVYRPETKPVQLEKEVGCYSSLAGGLIAPGSYYDPINGKTCTRILCYEDNGGVSVVGCGHQEVSQNCRIEADYTQPYPGCCGKIVCD